MREKFDAIILKNLPYYRKENGYQGKKKKFDDLTLNDYISIFTAKDTWSFYEPIFHMDRGIGTGAIEQYSQYP